MKRLLIKTPSIKGIIYKRPKTLINHRKDFFYYIDDSVEAKMKLAIEVEEQVEELNKLKITKNYLFKTKKYKTKN